MSTDLKKTWHLLRPHVRPRIPNLCLVALFGAITAFCQASVLVLFPPIWDQVLFPDQSEAGATKVNWVGQQFISLRDWSVSAGLFEDGRLAVLAALVVIALVLAVVGAGAQFGFTWVSRRVGFQMIVDLRVRVARHLMGLSMRYHSQRRFGDLLSRISSDVTTTLQAVNVGLKSLLQEPLFALATICAAFYLAPIPTLGIIFLLPVVAYPVSKLASRVRKGSRKSLTTLGASVQVLSQMFSGIRTVKSFGGEDREVERYREVNNEYLRNSMRMVRAIALTHTWTAFYSVAGVAVLIGGFGYLNLRFDLFAEPGIAVGFFLTIARMNNHVKNFTKALTRVEESLGASGRIQDLFEEPEDVVEAEQPTHLTGLGRGLAFEGVSFRYSTGDEESSEGPALDSIDLVVQPGETLALAGPSGAGKSTLMDLVARFIDPTEGRITVDGEDLRQVKREDWTSLFALVGQVPFLFHTTIGENIRYGRAGATQEDVVEAARAADIHDFISSLPEGYETNVADMGARLSGGQRQRITIARALLKGAPLLLLDEATSALDSQSEAEVQAALERLMAHRTVIVIAHRLSTIQNADRICVLEGGRIVEVGSHAELISKTGTYAELYNLQKLGAPT